MAKTKSQKNNACENRGKKALIAAISVICALSVGIIAFLVCRNPLFLSIAVRKAENGNFSEALEYSQTIRTDEAEALSLYLNLRIDINESYPALITDFNPSIIADWTESVSEIDGVKELLSEELAAEAEHLGNTLRQINSCLNEYESIRGNILSLMDIFSELNRLYTKDINGKNNSFTVFEERAKISAWEYQLSILTDFAQSVPGYENIYLLSYLIKEVEGECVDLKSAMDSVIAMGYTETDLIRLSGSGQKQFPAITNSNNETVNLLQKEKYESFMYNGICVQLAEVLGEFYEV